MYGTQGSTDSAGRSHSLDLNRNAHPRCTLEHIGIIYDQLGIWHMECFQTLGENNLIHEAAAGGLGHRWLRRSAKQLLEDPRTMWLLLADVKMFSRSLYVALGAPKLPSHRRLPRSPSMFGADGVK